MGSVTQLQFRFIRLVNICLLWDSKLYCRHLRSASEGVRGSISNDPDMYCWCA